jgi:hypothetical protein
MQGKFGIYFFLCFAFLLTQKGHAESEGFKKAQSFFLQSQKATHSYLRSGKGLEGVENKTEVASRSTQTYVNPNATAKSYENVNDQGKSTFSTKALYFSLLSRTINDKNNENPNYSLSIAISVPVYSAFRYLSSEFQFSGDIQNAGDWGQVQFLQKESFHVVRLNETQIDLFVGMGFGYGHGSLISSNQRYFAPWATGIQWGKSHHASRAFYRFELGWTGDFYFLENNYNQGLLANVSLGYKL